VRAVWHSLFLGCTPNRAQIPFVAIREQENRLFWLILKNLVFFGLWIAALLSAAASHHTTAATWLEGCQKSCESFGTFAGI
jgi:hypothetical protein